MARTSYTRAPGPQELSILDALGRLDEAGLAALLAARPDLVDPPPRSLLDVAVRAATAASIEASRETLDLGAHQVHAALCLLPPPATVAQLARLLSVDVDDRDLADALGRLGDRALVSRDGERVVVLPGADIRNPAGLGPPVAAAFAAQSAAALATCAQRLGVAPGDSKARTLAAIAAALSEPGRLPRMLAKAPAGVAELASRLAYDGPEGYAVGAAYNGDKTAAGWLVNRGVLAPAGWDTVILVREAAVAIRGGKVFPNLSLSRPELSVAPIDTAGADRAAADRALQLVADIAAVLDGWAVDPPRQLKAGGLGIQSVRRAAKVTGRSDADAALVIELATAAGLLSVDHVSDVALPLAAYDHWLDVDAAHRWAHLAAAWMASDLHLSLAGAIDGKGKPIPPLLVRSPEKGAVARRLGVLAALLEAPAGSAVAADSALDRILWDAPALWTGGPASPGSLVSWNLAECDLIGLCGLGALSTWGRLAATGDFEAAAEALGRRVPAATSQFIVQADLTAVAPAELVRPVQAELESMASLESRGAASVYRFTEASVRRSYEAGRTASDILGFLEVHAAKGVPQALSYLVNDVGRRFGQLRVTATACCLRSDDPALLAEVVASRPAKRLGLRLLAPTVAAATAEPAAVLDALRTAGYVPAEEGPDGAIVLSRAAPRRAAPDPRRTALAGRRPGRSPAFGPVGVPSPPSKTPPDDDDRSPAAVAARLVRTDDQRGPQRPAPGADVAPVPKAGRSAPTTTRPHVPTAALFDIGASRGRPDGIARDPGSVVALLDEAWVEGWPVRLAYTNRNGRAAQLNVAVLDVGDRDVVVERLSDWQSQVLSLSRIEWARALTEAEEDSI